MKECIKKIVLTPIFAFLAFSSVQAEWYIGADAIQQQVIPYPSSLTESELSIDDILRYKEGGSSRENSVSLFGGYRTTEKFSLQLEYQDDLSFGIDDLFAGSSLWFPEEGTQDFESNGLFLSGISSYPINHNPFLYMKGGLFNWEVDTNY